MPFTTTQTPRATAAIRIDAATDRHLWARTYTRGLKDVFAVESEVSQDIAEALQARLSAGESGALAALPTKNAVRLSTVTHTHDHYHVSHHHKSGEMMGSF